MQRSMHSVWDLQLINSFSTSKIGGRIVEVVTTIRQVRGSVLGVGTQNAVF